MSVKHATGRMTDLVNVTRVEFVGDELRTAEASCERIRRARGVRPDFPVPADNQEAEEAAQFAS